MTDRVNPVPTGTNPIPSPFYRVSVKALIYDSDHRLLVLRDRDSRWQIPGGGWEHGESLEECLQRELDEEIGVRASSIDTSVLYPCVGRARLKLTVGAELEAGPFQVGDGMQEARYVSRDEFTRLNLGGGDDVLAAHVLEVWPR
jgi:8-oxo-dGTP pyrophosphatase MutT (NUDIX family)